MASKLGLHCHKLKCLIYGTLGITESRHNEAFLHFSFPFFLFVYSGAVILMVMNLESQTVQRVQRRI